MLKKLFPTTHAIRPVNTNRSPIRIATIHLFHQTSRKQPTWLNNNMSQSRQEFRQPAALDGGVICTSGTNIDNGKPVPKAP